MVEQVLVELVHVRDGGHLVGGGGDLITTELDQLGDDQLINLLWSLHCLFVVGVCCGGD